jgi:hypothetical protein
VGNGVSDEAEADRFRLVMMQFTDVTAAWHEWITGELAYFVGQGYTIEQAHAMAAAEYVSMFGTRIESGASRPEDNE